MSRDGSPATLHVRKEAQSAYQLRARPEGVAAQRSKANAQRRADGREMEHGGRISGPGVSYCAPAIAACVGSALSGRRRAL
jgi:hypothetical protein